MFTNTCITYIFACTVVVAIVIATTNLYSKCLRKTLERLDRKECFPFVWGIWPSSSYLRFLRKLSEHWQSFCVVTLCKVFANRTARSPYNRVCDTLVCRDGIDGVSQETGVSQKNVLSRYGREE